MSGASIGGGCWRPSARAPIEVGNARSSVKRGGRRRDAVSRFGVAAPPLATLKRGSRGRDPGHTGRHAPEQRLQLALGTY